ncbi:MAG: hypothetical protein FP824_10905 [Euryarchaeota archaeon]|nr:hypothetical protein [Euryarchaeota archaeon]
MKEKLSKRNTVLINIRAAEKEGDGSGAGFNELVERLDGQVSRATVSKALDSLFDMGILDSDWVLESGKWRKKISIANEAKPMVDKMIADLNERGLI